MRGISRRTFWWQAGSLIALMVGLNVLLVKLEPQPVTRHRPPQREALKKPLLAAQMLIAGMGRQVVGVAPPDITWLPQGPTTLILPAGRRFALHERERNRLIEWVAEGGHLIVEAEAGSDDALLAAFGLRAEYLDLEEPWIGMAEADRAAMERYAQGEAWPRPVLIPALECRSAPRDGFGFHLPGEARERRAWLLSARHLAWGPDKTPEWALYADRGAMLAGLRHGRGMVSAVVDFDLFANPQHWGDSDSMLRQRGGLIDADHASLLWWLARADGGQAPVWVVHRLPEVSLWDWLAAKAAPVLWASAALLLLALWRVLPRFGPLLLPPPPRCASLTDHLRASAAFIARHTGYGPLLQAQRERLAGDLARHGLALPAAEAAPRSLTAYVRASAALARPGAQAQHPHSRPLHSRVPSHESI